MWNGFNFGLDWNDALIAQTMLTVLTQIARGEPAIAATIPGVSNAGLESAVAPAVTRSRKTTPAQAAPSRVLQHNPRNSGHMHCNNDLHEPQ